MFHDLRVRFIILEMNRVIPSGFWVRRGRSTRALHGLTDKINFKGLLGNQPFKFLRELSYLEVKDVMRVHVIINKWSVW